MNKKNILQVFFLQNAYKDSSFRADKEGISEFFK